MTDAHPTNLFGLDREGLEAWFVERGEKPFRAHQLMKWVYHRRVTDFSRMSDFGRALRDRLASEATLAVPPMQSESQSRDGTCKWLYGIDAANAVETVFIPDGQRGTLCVSSQIGCMLNCRFCSTATQGFSRNLDAAEIIGQVWQAAGAIGHDAKTARRLTNVVMMGMGEPLLNLAQVVPALNLMRDDLGFGLANKRVTVSTAGLVPGIDALSAACDVSLAVSLHAPDDTLRSELVPLNRKYPIAELLAACKRYLASRPRACITFEYTMLKGINDAPTQARQLVRLLSHLPSKINLIPFNPFPGTRYQRSDESSIRRFQEVLMQHGFITTVRRTRGEDIDAACGQLKGQVLDRTRRQASFRAALGRALPVAVEVRT